MPRTKRVFTQTFCAVAAIIEKDGKFLLVREHAPDHPDHDKWNHPAGWLEVGENPLEAVKREVLEETGHSFSPTHLLGIYSLVRCEPDIKKYTGCTPHPVKLVFLGKLSDKLIQALHGDIDNCVAYVA